MPNAAQRGNPAKRRRGEAVRGVLMGALLDRPAGLQTVQMMCGLSQTGILWHLATLKLQRRIAGYTTERGVVTIWR